MPHRQGLISDNDKHGPMRAAEMRTHRHVCRAAAGVGEDSDAAWLTQPLALMASTSSSACDTALDIVRCTSAGRSRS
jgi:hypothetical protein